jgi:calcineurin-like phosphoesterase family protein
MWKLSLQPGQQLFFTSDTHYNHKNICRGVTAWRRQDGSIPTDQTRDFKTLEHMNSTIVNNINNKVGQDDILIHLGDWSFGGFEYIKEFRDRINCKNIYVLYGNHDHHIENNRNEIQNIFTNTFQYAVLEVTKPSHPILTQSKTTKHEFVLMHYPLTSWHDMNKGRMHLFGHVHLPKGKNVMGGRAMDVGMDGNNLTPYSLSEILTTLRGREIKATVLPSDHHEERLKGEQ